MKNLFFLLILSTLSANAQTFRTDLVASYNLSYKFGKQPQNEEFLLFMDTKADASYFVSSMGYVKDTANIKDPMVLLSYQSDFNERILRKGATFTTLENVHDFRMKYSENIDFKWTVLPNTKKIGSLSVQLARTNAFGRNWNAWFCKDIPVGFGPYKFGGLPGLIVNLYDDENTLNFTLKLFRKKARTVRLPDPAKYKTVTPAAFEQNRYRIITADEGVIIFKTPQERKEWMEGLRRSYFLAPRLDKRFPIK